MAAKHDLTMKMIPFLDRHLVFPLLEFLELKEVYVSKDLLKAKYDLFQNSNMVDFVLDLYNKLNSTEEAPKGTSSDTFLNITNISLAEFSEKREKVLGQMEDLRSKAQKFTDDSINILYEFGQFQYNCGDYGGAADYLYHYRILSTDADRSLSATWGKMAAEILTGNWDGALEEMQKLRESIDQKSFASPLQQLQQRTWLLHWSLFVFFNHPKGRDCIVDMFLSPQYINTIQTSCPWILRYLTTAVVTNKRRKHQMKELVKIIEQELYEYQDPVTQFIEALFVHFDFEGAQKKLKECEDVLMNDFFLAATQEDFMESARQFISETYCRIHQKIDIKEMSQRLNLSEEEGEKWIVNLIRDTRVDAKIDFEENTVIMNTPVTSIYQQVIERTKTLSFRSQVLASTIKRREQNNEATA
ncbi:hypothetical protein G6F63_010172 [Rhizopus arrhizus]|nr:hypothetical protein G6F21_010732 [Rhizopus arrhizus]KAG1333646.1 hypothetical protein G6F63_010172 [Rhizopus arrhizus]